MKPSLSTIARPFATAASLTLLLACPALADPPRFSIKDITPPGPADTNAGAFAINNAGQVAGFFADDSSFFYDDRDGSVVNIPANDFIATDINEAGAVVGTDADPTVILFENGVVTPIAVFEGTPSESFAGGLNDAGAVTGSVDAPPPDGTFQAFLYSDGTAEVLDLSVDQGSCTNSRGHDINNAGQIVGEIRMPDDGECTLRAFLHQDGETLLIGDLFPEQGTRATRINESGQALVVLQSTQSNVLGGGTYLYTDGDLEQIGDDQTTGHGLNESGWVVGEFGPRRDVHAFLYVNGEFYELADLVDDFTGWERLSIARDVNDSGQIVGLADREDGRQVAFLLTPLDVEVKLDVRPGSKKNKINLRSKGTIPVAILSTGKFDATQVDWETVKFGPKKAREVHERIHLRDVDGDGDMDAVLHFKIRKAGIRCHDKKVTLTGKTFSGVEFRGTDRIRIVKCRR